MVFHRSLHSGGHAPLRNHKAGRNPLESEGYGLGEAVEEERRRLAPAARSRGTWVMDTTDFSIHDLRRQLQDKWKFLEGQGPAMKVQTS